MQRKQTIILFLNFIIASTFFHFIFLVQYFETGRAYSQTVENEIIENTLNTVEKATAGISEITESLSNTTTANNNIIPNQNLTTIEVGVSNGKSEMSMNGTNTNLSKADAVKQPVWINYTDEVDGFTIEQPSDWIVDDILNKIENSNQSASFEYSVLLPSYNSYKVMTRVSAIDKIVNYDNTYDERIIFEKPNMTKYIIDGENAGSYLYLQNLKILFLMEIMWKK